MTLKARTNGCHVLGLYQEGEVLKWGQGLGTRKEPHKHVGIVAGKGAAVWVIGEEGGGCVGKGPS